jgi:hypothetical protein
VQDDDPLVEIVDPNHRLYGFRLPLVRTLTHPQRGRLCAVRLYPNLECYVPLAATQLVGRAQPPSCRVSLVAIRRLLQAIASMMPEWEEWHATSTVPKLSATRGCPTPISVTAASDSNGTVATIAAADDSSSVSVAHSGANAARADTADDSPGDDRRAPRGFEA